MKEYAPVVIYTYDRLDHLKKTVAALRANYLAAETEVFVVSDGPKDENAKPRVKTLREYIDSIDGFKAVHRVYRNDNVGVFKSVLLAEQLILSEFSRLITIEDDIVTSKNFLDFINAGLDHYEHSDTALTIAGYCHPIKMPNDYRFDSWNSPWYMPWGFGIWKHKYINIDLNMNPLQKIMQINTKYSILKKHGDFFIDALDYDNRGLMVASDSRISGQMLLDGLYTVMPLKSKVRNIGCDGSGAHSPDSERYNVDLDDGRQRVFEFAPDGVDFNSQIAINYLKFMNGGLYTRTQRQIIRNLRKIEFLRKIKKRLIP